VLKLKKNKTKVVKQGKGQRSTKKYLKVQSKRTKKGAKQQNQKRHQGVEEPKEAPLSNKTRKDANE